MTKNGFSFPIVDEESGEVLAANEEDRQELVALLADDLIEAEYQAARQPMLRRKLGQLMSRNQPWARGGYAVLRQAPSTPALKVIEHAVDKHHEDLVLLGLAATEKIKVVRTYPKVSDLTSPQARNALARLGLSVETFVHRPPDAEDKIVVVTPERQERAA